MNAPAELLHVLPPEADRRLFLGGSDAAAIMGVGATYRGETQTAYTVWSKKTSAEPEELDPATQKFFRNRKRYEIPIMEALQEEFAAEIVAKNKRYRDPALDFLAAEIDFEWRDPADGSIQNGEIKTVHPLAFGDKFGWGEPMTDEIPVHYAAQVMHGLGVTGRRTEFDVRAIASRSHTHPNREARMAITREKLIGQLVDDVLDGEALKLSPSRYRAACDFINDDGVEMWLDGEDLANLICGNDEGRQYVERKLRDGLREKVRAWLEGHGADYVTERLESILEDERADAEETRRRG